MDPLAYLLNSQLELDPFSGQVFLFCGGRKDRFKALLLGCPRFLDMIQTFWERKTNLDQ